MLFEYNRTTYYKYTQKPAIVRLLVDLNYILLPPKRWRKFIQNKARKKFRADAYTIREGLDFETQRSAG